MSDQYVVGLVETIVIAAPAAGANFTYTIPAGRRFHVRGIAFNFAADANVANRQPCIYVTDPMGGNSMVAVCQATVPAGSGTDFFFAPNNRDMAAAVGGYCSVPMASRLILLPGDILNSDIQNIQVGDQIMEIYLLSETFLLP